MGDDLLTVECPTCGRSGLLPVNNPAAKAPTRADHTRFVLLPPRYAIQQGPCDACSQMITLKAACHGRYYCRKCSEAPCDCSRRGPGKADGKGAKSPASRAGLRVVK